MRTRPSVRPTAVAAAVAALALLPAGCGRADLGEVLDGTSATADADDVVTVTVEDDACRVSSTAMADGSVAFVVSNDTSEDARFRLYSGGTDAIGEIPEVAAGATTSLLVDDVVPGDYVAACSVDGGAEVRVAMRAGKEPL